MESKKMKSESAVPGEQKKTEFALGKTNIILIAVAFVVIVVGFLLMLGPGTSFCRFRFHGLCDHA